jgi:hypothetical protein
MEIRDEHVEWAVISRLRDMLRDSAKAEFDITQAYAFFSAIILWTAQRMRTKGHGPGDEAARRFYERMQKEDFGPFQTRRQPHHSVADLPAQEPVAGAKVAEVVIAIRNGLAHGDGRTVKPLHRKSSAGKMTLVGFHIPWDAHAIILTGPMMVGFGTWLADEFILALRADEDRSPQRDQQTLSFINDEVKHVREARQ